MSQKLESKTVLLITGRPGVGKTTLVRRAIDDFEGRAGGFFTRELRERGRRVGFAIATFEGEEAVLAHVDNLVETRVSRYGVDLATLDRLGVEALRRATRECDLVVVDEIGKMELLSESFRAAVRAAVASGKPVLGTVMMGPHPWTDELKRDPRVEVIRIDEANRATVAERVAVWLRSGR